MKNIFYSVIICISLLSYPLIVMGMGGKTIGIKDGPENIPEKGWWVQTNGPDSGIVNTLTVSGTNLFAGTNGGVFLSTNNGTSWTQVNSGLTNNNVNTLAISPNGAGGTNLFAGTEGGGVFLSTDNGASWTEADSGLSDNFITTLVISDTNLFAGTEGGGVFLSTNNGISWTEADNGLPNNFIITLVVSPNSAGGTNLFAGTSDGIFLSTDNGASWSATGLKDSSGYVNALAVFANGAGGTNLFAGIGYAYFLPGEVFRSTDDGTSWTAVNNGLTFNGGVCALTLSDTNLFAGTFYSGVFLSTNNGTSWTQVNTGLTTNTTVFSLTVSGSNLFAGTGGSGVWVRPLSEMITTVDNDPNSIPNHFELKQNYPNPFNPTTSIEYQVANTKYVTLKVYDVLGREVATLVNEEKQPGTYEVNFYASNLSSGIYFYQLKAGNFFETKKMILLK